MTILDGDRAAVVVELLDLLIVIAVGKDGLLGVTDPFIPIYETRSSALQGHATFAEDVGPYTTPVVFSPPVAVSFDCPQSVSSRSIPIIRVMIFFFMRVSPFCVLGSTNNYHTTIRKSTERSTMTYYGGRPSGTSRSHAHIMPPIFM